MSLQVESADDDAAEGEEGIVDVGAAFAPQPTDVFPIRSHALCGIWPAPELYRDAIAYGAVPSHKPDLPGRGPDAEAVEHVSRELQVWGRPPGSIE